MSGAAPAARITTLMSNELLARVERMQLLASRRFTNRSRGEHSTRGGGTSIEFKDFRDYVAGDDVRFVDWNIFARLQRPYVKLFHAEEERYLVLLVDASASMDFEEKLTRACQLAAVLGVMGLVAGERVTVHVFNQRGGKTTSLSPLRGRGKRRDLLAFLEAVQPGGDGPVEEAVEAMLRSHRGRGVLFLLSDFLTTGDLGRSLSGAFGRGLLPYGIQLLGPSELDPELSSDLRLIDVETEAVLDVTATGELVGLYREYLDGLVGRVHALCRQRGGDFLGLDASLTLEHVVGDVLRRRGWAR